MRKVMYTCTMNGVLKQTVATLAEARLWEKMSRPRAKMESQVYLVDLGHNLSIDDKAEKRRTAIYNRAHKS